jgi:hypothetical protein
MSGIDLKTFNFSDLINSFRPAIPVEDISNKKSFKVLLEEEQKKESPAKAVKIGDYAYKLMAMERRGPDPQPSKEKTSEKSENKPAQSKEQNVDTAPSSIQGISFHIFIIQPNQFMSNLEPAVKNFIKESFEVIKKFEVSSKTLQYEFNFKNLPLKFEFQKIENVVKVTITIKDNDSDLVKDLRVYREDLLKMLKDLLPDKEVALEVRTDQENQSQEQGQGEPKEKQEEKNSDEPQLDLGKFTIERPA